MAERISESGSKDLSVNRLQAGPGDTPSETFAASGNNPFLHRKAACACGGGCPSCQAKTAGVAVSQPHDSEEHEADSMADAVMRMPAGGQPAPVRGAAQAPAAAGPSSGRSMDAGTRSFMESRFGHDFSGVRIHDDAGAAESARSLDAHAYTYGNDIVFGSGQYDPRSNSGKHLLAHELAHVVQAQTGRVSAKKIRRATFEWRGLNIIVNYDTLSKVTNSHDAAKARIETFTKTAIDPEADKKITALSLPQQHWLVYALATLIHNTKGRFAALDRTAAVNNLIRHAAVYRNEPDGPGLDAVKPFVREALFQSGWFEVAIGNVGAPLADTKAAVKAILNPAYGQGADFKEEEFKKRLTDAMVKYLKFVDPDRWKSPKTQSMTDIQGVGDAILEEARIFFQPYVDASRASIFNTSPAWKASANISSANVVVPDPDKRKEYIRNRAQFVGTATKKIDGAIDDLNIFGSTKFGGAQGAAALGDLVDSLEKDTALKPVVDRLVQHTAHEDGLGGKAHIDIDPQYDSKNTTECQARWETIDILCHEIMHALVHPGFLKAKVGFPLVLSEGYPEVLGNMLYNEHLVVKASDTNNPAFRAKFEIGLKIKPCPGFPAAGKIDYGAAGQAADEIKDKVGPERFKAAYFLGRLDLLGM